MFTLSAAVMLFVGCARYLLASDPSPYARRVFKIYLVCFGLGWLIFALEVKAFAVFLMPVFYTLLFSAFELNKALTERDIPEKDRLNWEFFKPIAILTVFCAAVAAYVLTTRGA